MEILKDLLNHCRLREIMKKIYIFLTIQILTLNISMVNACEMPAEQVLKIACLDDCGYFVEKAINKAAKELNYHVQLETLQSSVIDPAIAYHGFIIPGGADISSSYYNTGLPVELSKLIDSLNYLVDYSEEGARRDPIEYGFVRSYRTDERYAQSPLLGLCRGLQMMAVASDIPLYVDIRTELHIPNRINLFDEITFIETSSEISKLAGPIPFKAYKYHHQAIRYDYFLKNNLNLASNVEILALSNENKIPEVVKFNNRPALGTQFHPEQTDEGNVQEVFFKWFLKKSCKKAKL